MPSACATRLRLANAEYERLASMADRWWHISWELGERGGRGLLYRLGPERFTDRVLLAWTRSPHGAADQPWRLLATLPARWAAPAFPLKAADFIARGVPPGPRLGAALAAAEEAWIAAGFPVGRGGGGGDRGCGGGEGDVTGAARSGRSLQEPRGCDSLDAALRLDVRAAMSTTRRPADIARRAAKALAGRERPRDAFRRETFALPREAAREKAREMFRRFPKAAYMTEIESWRVLPGDRIEFTVRRLPSAD